MKILKTSLFVLTLLAAAGIAQAQTQDPAATVPPPPATTEPPPSTSDGGGGTSATPPPVYQPMPMEQPQNFTQPMQPMQPTQPMMPMQPMDSQSTRPMYDNQSGMQNNAPSNQGQGNFQGQQFNQGGNNEEMQKRNEEMQKKNEERRMQDMKRGLKSMDKAIASTEKRIKAAQAKGVTIPKDTQEAFDKAKALIAQGKAAQTSEELQDLGFEDFGDLMQTINEGWQVIEMATQFPKIAKEADKELTRQRKEFTKAETRAKKLKVDATSLISDWKAEIDKMAAVREKAQQLLTEGKADEAMESMREDFFGNMETLMEKKKVFEIVSNTQKVVKSADTEIKRFAKLITQLRKKGEDTTTLEDLLEQGKTKLSEIKQVMSQTPIDSEALISSLEELQELGSDFDQEYNDLTGQGTGTGPQMMQIPGLQNFKPMEIPQSFNYFMGPSSGPTMGNPGMNPMKSPGQGPQTCNINGVEVPGTCEELQSKTKTAPVAEAPTTTTSATPQISQTEKQEQLKTMQAQLLNLLQMVGKLKPAQ